MRSLTLTELPAPPPGHTGWPWTEASPQLPNAMADGRPWPRISIVTPSFNQGPFIEETIRSVLLQGYPNLEYIIMDGGSTDDSVEIIRKYEPWLTHWLSEPDGGQADALRKGFTIATGDIFGWINSDDLYAPRALEASALTWCPDRPCLVAGPVTNFRSTIATPIRTIVPMAISSRSVLMHWTSGVRWHQPGILMDATIYRQVGGVDTSLHLAMDFELYLRMLQQDGRVAYATEPLAFFRVHAGSKTTGATALAPSLGREYLRVISGYRTQLSFEEWRDCLLYYVMGALRRVVAAGRRGKYRMSISNVGFAAYALSRIGTWTSQPTCTTPGDGLE